MLFEDFNFDESIQKGIKDAGFIHATPVQEQCFKLLIDEHRDVYAQSQTGTGKTAAFLLGIFQLIVSDEKYKKAQALIVVPTRELAVQIENEGILLGKYLDLKIGSVFGGVGYGSQEKMLEEGVDILIGTPGRLIDFSRKRKINFKDFDFMVVDEADRLFDMGFMPDLKRIFNGMKSCDERHTLLFSATLNARVGNLAWEYMNNPGEVIIEPEKLTVDTVTQELYHVGKVEKMHLLLGLLKRDDPDNAVIFTNTRHSAWEVAKRLEMNGYKVKALMGDLPQAKRLKIVNDVKKGKHKYLVATDVAARGLHIEELEMVINYDVPLDAEGYIHRIGRTARAGKEGKTIMMACEEYVYGLGPIEKLLGYKLPVCWVDESLLLKDKSDGMRFSSAERHRENKPEYMKNGNKPPRRHGAVAPRSMLNQRSKRVQSEVSSVVGGKLDEISPSTSKLPKRTSTPKSPKRSQSPVNFKRIEEPGTRKRIDRGRKTANSNTEGRYISSVLSIEERLEIYRKKYGEKFQLSGVISKDNKKDTPTSFDSGNENSEPKKKKGILKRILGG